jgi:hypothetical protein
MITLHKKKVTSGIDFDRALKRIDCAFVAEFGTNDIVIFVELLDDRILDDLLFLCQDP